MTKYEVGHQVQPTGQRGLSFGSGDDVVELTRLSVDERRVARITIARADRKNAFDAELIAQLTHAVEAVPADARCVVLGSEGDTFCAGADLAWMRSMAGYTLEENLADSGALADLFAKLDALPMPLIARIQGAAIGGGAGLVAMADIAVAVEAATFAFTEVRLGILPAVVSPYVVRKVGLSFATAAFTTGIRFDSHRAFETGLVHSVVDEGQLDPEIGRFVDAILSGGPEAVNAAKRLVRDVAGRTPAEVRDLTVERIASVRVSAEGQDGMRAFLEKRAPRWLGGSRRQS
ncbi:MAG TPA: enoyl-CoA hydratase-related protein [Candidatus Limnocylindria bacterium]|nr:enoyl-CoA hydratase-related protein [Candidatus Limnocylindria bacterium]